MPWFVIQTNAGRQQWAWAAAGLRHAKFEVYAPLCREADAHPDTAKPMFEWYLFVERPHRRQGWHGIEKTPGVKGVLRAATDRPPLPLAEGVVEGLQALERGGSIELVPRFISGQGLRIVSGIFAGQEGIVSRKKGKRVLAMLRFLGGEREVEFDEGDIEALDAPYRYAV